MLEINHFERLKPYLIQAFRDYCIHNNLSIHMQVAVSDDDKQIQVPTPYVKNGIICLSLNPKACKNLEFNLDTRLLTFYATFNTVEYAIVVPIDKLLTVFDPANPEFQLYFYVEEPVGDAAVHPPTLQVVASNKEVVEKTNSIKPTLRIVK